MEEVEQLRQTVSSLEGALTYWQVLFWIMIALCFVQGWYFKRDWRWAMALVRKYEALTARLLARLSERDDEEEDHS